MPDYLSESAREIWARVVGQLEGVGVLSQTDERALARYCQLQGQYEQIAALRGVKALMVAMRLSEHLLKLEQHFGLTPSARAHMARPAAPKRKDLSKYNLGRAAG